METDKAALLLVERARVSYAARDLEQALSFLTVAFDKARSRGEAREASRAGALLGLIQFERGDAEGAAQWFRASRFPGDPHSREPWQASLEALDAIHQAHQAALGAERELSQACHQIREEIRSLEGKARDAAASLHEYLLDGRAATAHRTPATDETLWRVEASPASLAVRFLGDFEVYLQDGSPVKLCTNRKGASLFKLLATNPKDRFYKETLLNLLWRDEYPDSATMKLHVAASRLRRSLFEAGLGSGALLFEDDCYFLSEHLTISSDVASFEAHVLAGQRFQSVQEADLAAGEYQAALDLYRGPYLADLGSEEWTLPRRAQLEEAYLKSLGHMAMWTLENARYEMCVDQCKKILAIDNLREDAYRLLMQSLARLGRRSDALRAYAGCARSLREELGVAPMKSTSELVDRIRRDEI